jgi:prepilin-type N-terminal cleavage/methylation domain-containing protein
MRKIRGFTLIELMLVVAIIGLLAAIAIPKFSDMIDKSREAALKGQLGTLRSALTLYYADNEGVYPRYHALFLPDAAGMFLLHPKYVDLNSMTFYIPRYAVNATNSNSSMTAMQLYGVPGSQFTLYNTARAAPSALTPIHFASPFPSYFVWCPAVGSMGTYANIAVQPLTTSFTYLQDLKGAGWSNW